MTGSLECFLSLVALETARPPMSGTLLILDLKEGYGKHQKVLSQF